MIDPEKNKIAMVKTRKKKKDADLHTFRVDVRPEVAERLTRALISMYVGYSRRRDIRPQEAADLARFKRGMEK